MRNNKKPTNRRGKAKRHATQLLKISADILGAVLVMIWRQTVTELLEPLPAGHVLRTFKQYSIAFCSRTEAASDVISGVDVESRPCPYGCRCNIWRFYVKAFLSYAIRSLYDRRTTTNYESYNQCLMQKHYEEFRLKCHR